MNDLFTSDDDISRILADHVDVVRHLGSVIPDIKSVADRLVACVEQGNTVFWMGNGGSAADSQHLAAEFVGRFRRERSAFASVALTTDTSVLTAVGNDYGFDAVFRRQIEALCDTGDVVVGISTSGNSENVLQAVDAASEIGAYTVGLTGRDGGGLLKRVDTCLRVPSDETARIQEAHILVGHVLCEQVEQSITSTRQQ
jgi:D-sedoheptulose 7-phosphate isomerase